MVMMRIITANLLFVTKFQSKTSSLYSMAFRNNPLIPIPMIIKEGELL